MDSFAGVYGIHKERVAALFSTGANEGDAKNRTQPTPAAGIISFLHAAFSAGATALVYEIYYCRGCVCYSAAKVKKAPAAAKHIHTNARLHPTWRRKKELDDLLCDL
jgi:hypothetical protein